MVKVPGIPSSAKQVRRRGLLRQVTLPDGTRSLRMSAPLGGKFYSQPRYESAAVFAWVMWATTVAIDLDRISAELHAPDTLKLPRDLLAMAMYGTLITVTTRDGVIHYPARLVTKEVQVLLDQISQNPGDMLVRSAEGWIALTPTIAGNILTSQGPGMLPTFAAPGGGGGGGSGYEAAHAVVDPANFYTAPDPCIHTWVTTETDTFINGMWYWQDPAAGATYQPFVAHMHSSAPPAVIDDLTLGPADATGVNGFAYWQHFKLGANVLLQQGETYAIGLLRTDAGPTGTMNHNSGTNQNYAACWPARQLYQAWDAVDTLAVGDTIGGSSATPKSFTMGYDWKPAT